MTFDPHIPRRDCGTAGSVSFLNAEVGGNVWDCCLQTGRHSFQKNNATTCTNTEQIYRNERFWIGEAARSLRIWLLNSGWGGAIQPDRRFLWAPVNEKGERGR